MERMKGHEDDDGGGDRLKRLLRPVCSAGGFPVPDSQLGESLEVRLLQSGAARHSRNEHGQHMSEGNGKVLDKMAPVRGTRTTLDRLDSALEMVSDAAKLLYAGDQSAVPDAEVALRVVAGIVTELRVTCMDKEKGPLADSAGGECVVNHACLG